jgi:ABC-type transport system involved in multi-copper enzyme maturation permease subunit
VSGLTERPKRLDAFESVFQVAQLSVRRSFKGWRPFAALLVVLLPAGLALLVSRGGALPQHQERFFYNMLAYYHFGIAVPFVALLFATGFPWPEAEEGTLTYWFTSPVRRWTVLLGRWLASLLVAAPVLCLGVIAIGLPLEVPPEAELGGVMRTALACTLLAFPAYLALYQLLAVVWRWGLILGILFILLENGVSVIQGAIARATLIYYVRSHLLPAIPIASRGLAQKSFNVIEPVTTMESVTMFALVTLVALGLSLLLVERIEYRGRSTQTA